MQPQLFFKTTWSCSVDDIKRVRPVRPQPPMQSPPPQPPIPLESAVPEQPNPAQIPPSSDEPAPKKRAWWKVIVVAVLALIVLVAGTFFIWYQTQLSPLDPDTDSRTLVVVEAGSTPNGIAALLKDESLIKSAEAFLLYTRITGTQNSLQAGSYRLSAAQSVPEIVEALTSGQVESFSVTFIPGMTLAEQRVVFEQAGYTSEQIDTAFTAEYDVPFLADKPAQADLEGYIYPETYQVASGASVEDILRQTFTEYQRVIDENNLVEGFAAQGLSVFEGITLASIIEKESIGGDEAQIAQVFLLRLEMGMQLGSDVTYQYIADKLGVARDVNLDNPYNTRRFTGLPPGPISAPGLPNLLAVANPAEGDFVYFLSGDDDVTYFARTLEQHERNIIEKCQIKCQII